MMKKKNKSVINNRGELKAIKAKMKDKAKDTEAGFVTDFNTITTLLDITRFYKNKKYEPVKKDVHALVVQFVSEYLKDFKPFGREQERLNQLLVPSLTLGISLLAVNLTRKKSNKKDD